MITETRQSRTRQMHYEYHHRRNRRRHHTLDNATLDKFNFICVPLHSDESRFDSSLSSAHRNLTMTKPKHFSTITTAIVLPPTTVSTIASASRRVRFKIDESDKSQQPFNFNNNRHTCSTDDVRSPQKNSIHRVEFEIPIHKDINPWLNVDYSTASSTPAKTRSITTQKIDMKHTNDSTVRLHAIAPFIEAEISSQSPTANNADKTQSQWYRQMYGHLHKPLEMKQDRQQNPYKPTYVFPDEFHGDINVMEDYIRKQAAQTNNENGEKQHSSSLRIPTTNLKDHKPSIKRTNGHIEKVTRFEDHYSSPIVLSPTDQHKSNGESSTSFTYPTSNNQRLNLNDISTLDNDQKSIQKRVLHAEEPSSNDLPQPSYNNQGKNKMQRVEIYECEFPS